MTAITPDTTEKGNEAIHELRARCERCRDLLCELAHIHLEIDAPTRRMQSDEPDWIGRLRKICLHVLAINIWEIGADVEHVMATELRAAYEQMGAVWEDLPEMFRMGVDDSEWAEEAKNGMLAIYDHPTPQSLMLPAGQGGLGNGENGRSYAQLAVWIGRLGLGYGLTLPYLAQVLGVEADVDARVTAVLERIPESRS